MGGRTEEEFWNATWAQVNFVIKEIDALINNAQSQAKRPGNIPLIKSMKDLPGWNGRKVE